jgi:hypothetical protein
MDDRELTCAAVHDVLVVMPGWAVGPCQFHADDDSWHVAAVDLRPRGRQAKREAIEATGKTEIAALRSLATLPAARQISRRYGTVSHPAVGPRLRTGRSALVGGWDAHRASGGRPPFDGPGSTATMRGRWVVMTCGPRPVAGTAPI